MYFSDRQSQVGNINANPQNVNPYSTQGRIDVGGPDYGARLNQLFGASGILTLAYGQHADRFVTQPTGRGVVQMIDITTHRRTRRLPDYFGGFGMVLGPVANNTLAARRTPATTPATSATTSSRSAATTRRSRPRERRYYTGA